MNKFLSKNVLNLYTLVGLSQNCQFSTPVYIQGLSKAVHLLSLPMPLFSKPFTLTF